MSSFNKKEIISIQLFEKIITKRVSDPGYCLKIADQRLRRKGFVGTKPIHIVAADHPARGSLKAGTDPFAMADRHDLLARLTLILQSQWVDGVLGSMDILEELLILHGLKKNETGEGFLDNKLLISSFNRGGLTGSAWELDDPITGPDADSCEKFGIDASKMLLRVNFDDKNSLKTIEYCADGIRDMNRINRPIFIEPLPVELAEDGYKVVSDPDKLIQLINVSSALGDSSRNMWLKIPFTKEFKRVVDSTTLPVVILGGGTNHSKEEFLNTIKMAMETGAQIRGTMIGRIMLYPKDSDPLEMAESIGKVVHENIVPAL